MNALTTLLIFLGGAGVGCCVLFGIILRLVKEDKKKKVKIPHVECPHDFDIKAVFQGQVLMCKLCGWTVLDSSLFELRERDLHILNRILEDGDTSVRIAITSKEETSH